MAAKDMLQELSSLQQIKQRVKEAAGTLLGRDDDVDHQEEKNMPCMSQNLQTT